MSEKQILGAVFAVNLVGGPSTVGGLGERVGLGRSEAKKAFDTLIRRGLLKKQGGKITLTEKGRRALKVVFIGGGFEVIHRGHLHTIETAKALGDVLVVTVARNSTIRKRKGRDPVSSELERVALLSSLRQVDAAILGVEGNIYDTLEKVKPDVVALGYDQHHSETEIVKEAARRGLKLRVVRLDSPFPGVKTTALLEET
jgi:FAD synthetase